jgi:hypothetical protein
MEPRACLETETVTTENQSWQPEVIADASGKWTPNRVRFATKAEADAYLVNLADRWTSVTDTRAVESSDPVNSRWENGRIVHLDLIGAAQ